jgi:hypothetical protein
MNFMGLWAIVAGMGLGYAVEWIRGRELLCKHKRLGMKFSIPIIGVLVAADFIVTLHLRRDSVEDEAISRVTPAEVALQEAADLGPGSTFIVTMDPLVVQMYAAPETRVVDLESVDLATIRALVVENLHLILLRRTDRFADADFSRYGDPIRYVLSLPWQPLASGGGFQVSSLGPKDHR